MSIHFGEMILREPQVRLMTGISRVTRWRWARQGRFPKPVRIGPNTSGWLKSEIDAWLQACVARRDGCVSPSDFR